MRKMLASFCRNWGPIVLSDANGVTSVNVLFEGLNSKIRVGELNGFRLGVVGRIGTDSATRTLPLGRTAAGLSVAPICSGIPRDKSKGKSGPLLQRSVFVS